MFMRTIGRRGTQPFLFCALVCVLSLAAPLAKGQTPTASEAPVSSSEIQQLRQMILEQQRQIDELRHAMANQKGTESAATAKADAANLEEAATPSRGGFGEIASTTPVLPPIPALTTVVVPLPAPQAAAAAPSDAVQKAIDAINANLRGFRLSGDVRFRTDVQLRESNPNFPSSDNRSTPVQRARERYRFRFNIDKDLYYKDGDRAMASFHVQLATDPFNNPSTMDTDFTAFGTRAPISISEAYIDFRPTRSLTLRAGRTAELYADNRQFVYDDDIRFNGFHETYRWAGKKNGLFVQFAAAQYLLTDPNIQIVPAGSAFITIGYPQGTRVPSSGLFDQGITVGSNIGKKWSHNETLNFFAVREPNQIQLASTNAGIALFNINPVVGATLGTSNLPETGNATTTSGGPVYFAEGFEVVRGAFNLNYSGKMLYGHNYPFQLFFQATHNTKASIENNAVMGGFAFGQTARLGDIQFQYQYYRKEANAFVSQFTDDDQGSGTGVNLKGHEIRLNFGLTRFLAWENRLYIQNGLTQNNPAINYFVPLQQGYNTQYRIHSQFVFTF